MIATCLRSCAPGTQTKIPSTLDPGFGEPASHSSAKFLGIIYTSLTAVKGITGFSCILLQGLFHQPWRTDVPRENSGKPGHVIPWGSPEIILLCIVFDEPTQSYELSPLVL